MSRLYSAAKVAALAALVATQVTAQFAPNSVAVYWGQNSFGASTGNNAQQSLATYCASKFLRLQRSERPRYPILC